LSSLHRHFIGILSAIYRQCWRAKPKECPSPSSLSICALDAGEGFLAPNASLLPSFFNNASDLSVCIGETANFRQVQLLFFNNADQAFHITVFFGFTNRDHFNSLLTETNTATLERGQEWELDGVIADLVSPKRRECVGFLGPTMTPGWTPF